MDTQPQPQPQHGNQPNQSNPHQNANPNNGWVPPAPQDPSNGQHGGYKFFQALRSTGFFRSESRWLGGVAGGLARKLNVDPIVVRLVLIILGITLTGVALIAYAAAWALLPEERDGRIHAEELFRGNFDSAVIAISVTAFLGFGSLGGSVIFGVNFIPEPLIGLFWIALLAAGAYATYVVYTNYKKTESMNSQNGQPFEGTNNSAAQPQGSVPNGTAAPQRQSGVNAQQGSNSPLPHQNAPSGPHTTAGFTQTQPAPNGWQPTQTYGPGVYPPNPSYGTSQPPRPPVSGQPKTANVWDSSSLPLPKESSGGFLIAFALFLIAAAAILAAQTVGWFSAGFTIVPLTIATAVVIGGVVVTVNGLRGKTSGSGGFFAVLAMLAGIFIAVPSLYGVNYTNQNFRPISDQISIPTTAEDLENAFNFSIGDLTLDLTQLSYAEFQKLEQPYKIKISGGVGDIEVRLPSDVPIAVETTIGVGSYVDPRVSESGINGNAAKYNNDGSKTLFSEEVLELEIGLGIGDVTLTSVESNMVSNNTTGIIEEEATS